MSNEILGHGLVIDLELWRNSHAAIDEDPNQTFSYPLIIRSNKPAYRQMWKNAMDTDPNLIKRTENLYEVRRPDSLVEKFREGVLNWSVGLFIITGQNTLTDN